MQTIAPLQHLLWLSSPALPIGSYAYSRGLEEAAQRGIVHDEGSLHRWISGVLCNQLATLDAAVLVRVMQAIRDGNQPQVLHYVALLGAFRETRELALEDVQLGAALLRVLRERGVAGASNLPSQTGHAVAFAIGCAHYGIHVEQAVCGFLFAFAENQVTCALKCMQLGQTAGQRVLALLMQEIEPLVPKILALEDDDIGSYAPGLALLSAHHETQYSRLFRS